MQITYNDRNYSTIPQEEWEYIAQAVVKNQIRGREADISNGVKNSIEVRYEPFLRPTDAAIYFLGEVSFYGFDTEVDIIPPGLLGKSWQEWRKELGI
jgi:hypothetical protein